MQQFGAGRTARATAVLWILGAGALLASCDDDATGLDANEVRVEGTVTAANGGNAIAGAEVTITAVTQTASRVTETTTTDASGAYVVGITMPDGCEDDGRETVIVSARKTGYEPTEVGGLLSPLRVPCGQSSRVDLEMDVAP